MKLKGKVGLLTGSGRGIGAGIAMALAHEGVDLALADIDESSAHETADKIRKIGRRCIAIKVDVRKWDQVQAMVKRSIEELGQIDISVHNAGVISSAPIEELKEEEWDRIMDVNAKGVFLCCKAVVSHMKQRGSGKIINVSSIAGKNGYTNLAHYCASKFAVVGFTNTLAKELARDNITVNAICPGIVRTYMWDYLSEKWKLPGESIEESWQRHLNTMIPQGRAQTPEDMGAAVVYLVTAENVTGQAVNVDGGVELH